MVGVEAVVVIEAVAAAVLIDNLTTMTINPDRKDYPQRVTRAYSRTLERFNQLPDESQQEVLDGAAVLIEAVEEARSGRWTGVPKYSVMFVVEPGVQIAQAARSKITGAGGIERSEGTILLSSIFNGSRELIIWGVETPQELKERKAQAKGQFGVGREYHSKTYGYAGPNVKNTGLRH